jgi:hypothetical protein
MLAFILLLLPIFPILKADGKERVLLAIWAVLWQ